MGADVGEFCVVWRTPNAVKYHVIYHVAASVRGQVELIIVDERNLRPEEVVEKSPRVGNWKVELWFSEQSVQALSFLEAVWESPRTKF